MIRRGEDTVFEQALALAPAERAAFVRAACGDDDALRARIERLIAAEAEAPGFLQHPLMGSLPATLVEKPGDRIGRYALLDPLGEGGCGVVWRAEQREPMRREVALKIIKLGMDTREVISRFEAERQALALMDHPNIARVHDGGVTDTGRPYFVMEIVRGLPMTTFCETHRLGLRARIELFLQVCEAVEHAHLKGIIHRDLKPSNILVSAAESTASDSLGESEPGARQTTPPAQPPKSKIIDFGIAKATQGKLTDATLHTALNQVMGTPAYMSPEQAGACTDIDARSDVYSLGVVLYELLTGDLPFGRDALAQASPDEIRDLIRHRDPPRPSTQVGRLVAAQPSIGAFRTPPTTDLQLRRDLDWIVMRCLEKERARRYNGVTALVRDLRCYLEQKPVMARPPSLLYVSGKFVRRHWLVTAISGAALLSVVASTTIAIGLLSPERGPTPTPLPISEARKLAQQARALVDDDLLAVRENFKMAEELAQRATSLDPADPEAWATLARVSSGMILRAYDVSVGRREAAKMQAERALKLAPAMIETRLAMADYLNVIGRANEAEPLFRALLKSAPMDPRVVLGLARALPGTGKQEEATRLRLNHPAFAGRDPRPLLDEADHLILGAGLVAAERLVDRALALAPTVKSYERKLSYLATHWGDLEAAARFVEQIPARVLQEDSVAARAAWLWMRAGQPQRALNVIALFPRDFIEAGPHTYPKGYASGWALSLSGRTAAAQAEWRHALAVLDKRLLTEPNRENFLRCRAHLLALTGNAAEAEATHRLWRELADPSADELYDADFYCALGRKEDALRAIQTWIARPDIRRFRRNELRLEPRFALIRDTPLVRAIDAETVAILAEVRRERDRGIIVQPAATAPGEARRLVLQARSLIDDDLLAGRENFLLAEQLCLRATTLDPSDGEGWATLARISTEMIAHNYDGSERRREAARGHVERAQRLAPLSIEARLAMASFLLLLPDYAEAELRLRALMIDAPADARVALHLARALEAEHKISEATDVRLNHPAFGGRDPRPLVDEALRLRREQKLVDCQTLLDYAQSLAPTVRGYHWTLATLGNHWGDLKRTREFLETLPPRILQEDGVASLAAWFWTRLNEPQRALNVLSQLPREFIQEAFQVNPKGWQVGWALAAAGRRGAAQAEWAHALTVIETHRESEPNRPELLNQRAFLLALNGRHDEARLAWQLFREFKGMDGSKGKYEDAYFLCYVGDTEAAIRRAGDAHRTGRFRHDLPSLNILRFELPFAPIRDDPRIKAIIADGVAWIDQLHRAEVSPPYRRFVRPDRRR